MGTETNGQAGANGQNGNGSGAGTIGTGTTGTEGPQGPPWAYVDLNAVNNELRQIIASQTEEMAAMRVYIGQLHQALAAAVAATAAQVVDPSLSTPSPTP